MAAALKQTGGEFARFFVVGVGATLLHMAVYMLLNWVFDFSDKDALGIISVSWLGDDLSLAKDVPVDKRYEDYQNKTDTVATNLTTEVNVVKVSNPTEKNDFDPVAYKPYQVYINSGEYPLFRKVYMISTASNSTVLYSFYTFVTGFAGQKIISRTGILPYNVSARVVELK